MLKCLNGGRFVVVRLGKQSQRIVCGVLINQSKRISTGKTESVLLQQAGGSRCKKSGLLLGKDVCRWKEGRGGREEEAGRTCDVYEIFRRWAFFSSGRGGPSVATVRR